MVEEHSMDQLFVNKLTELLEVNLENEHFGVKELAKALGVSRSQLHRKVHAVNNSSTSQFIREFRLKKAMAMLQNNVATASEIAYRVGFSSPTYFNTCFRDYYGYPPGEVKHRKMLNVEETNIRSSDQVVSKQNSITTTSLGKVLFNKRMGIILSVVILALIAIAYTYFSVSKNNVVIEEVENITQDNTIAVLPFKNWSGDQELEYISDGMTDAVISRLTKIQAIETVIPFTSMLKYKNSDKSMPQIAKELGVRHILQGNFQLAGNRLKINLQLIDGPDNYHFWSEGYEGDWQSNDIFTLQAEVAENVAKNMNIVIKDEDLEAINRVPTQNKKAYALFLQANYQRNRTTQDSYKNAIPLYERTIELDPAFTEAYVELAEVWYESGLFSGIVGQQEAWTKAKDLSLKVLALDSTNIPIKDLLHFGYFAYDWNFKLAEQYYQTRLKSNDLGRDLGMDVNYPMMTGRFPETLLAIDNRISNMPQTIWSYPPKVGTLFFLGREDEAIELLGMKDTLFTHQIYYLQESARWYYYLGENEKSKNQLERYTAIFPDRPPIVLWLSAVHEHMDGDQEGIAKYLNELQKRYETGASGSPAWFIALYYCHTKDYESAFNWIDKSYDRHEVEMAWLREEPLLIPLRSDNRYLDLYAKVGFLMEPHSTPE